MTVFTRRSVHWSGKSTPIEELLSFEMDKNDGRFTDAERRRIKLLQRDKKCTICGLVPTKALNVHWGHSHGGTSLHLFGDVNGRLECFNVDHIIPKACGGNNSFFNLQLTCERCNSEKGNNFDMEMVHPERLKSGSTRRAHNVLVLRQRDELAKQVASLTEQLKEARRPQTFREVLENKLRRLIPTGYWS